MASLKASSCPSPSEKATEIKDVDTIDSITVHSTAEPKPVPIFALLKYATNFELLLDAVGLLAAIAVGAAQPLLSLFFGNLTQDFVDFGLFQTQNTNGGAEALVHEAKARLLRTASQDASHLAYVGVAVLLCTYVFMNVWIHTGELGTKRIRERYFRAILHQDIAFFDQTSPGEIATHIENDMYIIQQGISEKFAMTALHLSTFVSGFVTAYVRSWRLALALTPMSPCVFLAATLMSKFGSRFYRRSLQCVSQTGAIAEDAISTIRTVQAFGGQSSMSKKYDGKVHQARDAESTAAIAHGAGHAAFYFIIYSCYALAFWFGTTLVLRGEATPGAVVSVMYSVMVGSFSLAFLAPELQAINLAQVAAAKIFMVIDETSHRRRNTEGHGQGKRPAVVRGEMRFQDVTFSYPSRPDAPVLRAFSASFPLGKTIALVGPSGCGKTTVANLLERFYSPLSGQIKLDGTDIDELDVKWLRSQIGLVSQEPIMFSASVRENISYGLAGSAYANATKDEKWSLIQRAGTIANLDEFVSHLPMGYDTPVGDRGLQLSGGQRQRLAIARAIVAKPPILVLDEATSALDAQSEALVQQALDHACNGRTTIVIAHRLSTIIKADHIYVMKDGRIAEHGNHEELIVSEGLYAKYVEAQVFRNDASTESEHVPSSNDAHSHSKHEELCPSKEKFSEDQANNDLPGDTMTKSVSRNTSFRYLVRRLVTLSPDIRRYYAIAAIFGIFTGLVYPSFGILYAHAITSFQSPEPSAIRRSGDRNGLFFFIIALLAMTCVGMQNVFFGRSAAKLTSYVRSKLFESIMNQDVSFFDDDTHTTGRVLATLTSDPQKVGSFAGIALGAIVQSTTTIIAGSIIGLVFSWKIALVGIATMPLLLTTGYIRLRVVVARDLQARQYYKESAHLACETVAAIQTVAALTREDDCCTAYSESLAAPLKRSKQVSLVSNLIFSLSQSMQYLIISLVFWYGSHLVANEQVSTSRFFVCLFSVTWAAVQAGNVFVFVKDISSAHSAAIEIMDLLDSRPHINSGIGSQGPESPKHPRGKLQIKDVHFWYPSRPNMRVLEGLNITINAGEFVSLAGASGSGKSTIIQLLERFYDPQIGSILLDDQNITQLDLLSYRSHIALVSQEPALYAGTVKFNLLFGTSPESITQACIEDACRDANILDFIRSLPHGFDTELGGKGSQLSGGQRQRIAIARAIIRNPRVLLLDEATSALDAESEQMIQKTLERLREGCTIVVIAHRLSTIQNSDRIYFLKGGRMIETGTHDELMQLRGDYYHHASLLRQ